VPVGQERGGQLAHALLDLAPLLCAQGVAHLGEGLGEVERGLEVVVHPAIVAVELQRFNHHLGQTGRLQQLLEPLGVSQREHPRCGRIRGLGVAKLDKRTGRDRGPRVQVRTVPHGQGKTAARLQDAAHLAQR
jgi:hypothetical protein